MKLIILFFSCESSFSHADDFLLRYLLRKISPRNSTTCPQCSSHYLEYFKVTKRLCMRVKFNRKLDMRNLFDGRQKINSYMPSRKSSSVELYAPIIKPAANFTQSVAVYDISRLQLDFDEVSTSNRRIASCRAARTKSY